MRLEWYDCLIIGHAFLETVRYLAELEKEAEVNVVDNNIFVEASRHCISYRRESPRVRSPG
jgi:hypothetical protein